MIKLRTAIVTLLVLFAIDLQAQTKEILGLEPSTGIDLTLASTIESNAGAISIHRVHPVMFRKKLSFGYGLRMTGFQGFDNGYVTAPAWVSEGNFFKKQNEAKLDTLYVPSSTIGSINAAVYIEARISKRLFIEFNIDVAGISFGQNTKGRFEAYSLNMSPSEEEAVVTPYNLLLTGDYDIGSLNSELSLNILLFKRLLLRPGVSFLFTEYTTKKDLAFDNDRFRRKSLMPMLGIGYRFQK